jgi:hypothetical protein
MSAMQSLTCIESGWYRVSETFGALVPVFIQGEGVFDSSNQLLAFSFQQKYHHRNAKKFGNLPTYIFRKILTIKALPRRSLCLCGENHAFEISENEEFIWQKK